MSRQARSELWRHDFRRAGWAAWVAPLGALVATLAMTTLAVGGGAGRQQVRDLLLTGLEAIVPLAVAMAAVTAIAGDRSRELQLSLPANYVATLGRRVGSLVGAAFAVCVVFSVGVLAAGCWSGPRFVASPLVWAPPTIALVGLGVFIAVLTRSVVLATSGLAALWLTQQIYASAIGAVDWARPFLLFQTTRVGVTDGWALDRTLLAVVGVALVAAAAALLRRPDRLLTEEEA
ncbi:hypothetical protein C7C45_17695 [Micromonospora arborensis]|uniref:Uncharacterized protein n=1 Tax=Micromonospora arborensis TaxID=2116518 RepID=A0A318P0S6_9ACTN|nr:hypothetical protein [Micromonospora arborensis]PYC68814.1 hypothetical protein C7C45_17695 [Micromonospora arborensis]